MTVPLGILSPAHPHVSGFARRAVEMDGAELIGIADSDEERGRAFAEEHGSELMSEQQLLSQVDAVGVFSTTTSHGRWIEAAADAGVDVVCEKPLSTSVDEAIRVVDYCDSRSINIGMRQPQRLHDLVQRAKQQLAAGDIGSPQTIVGTNQVPIPRWVRFEDWTHTMSPEENGGGAVIDHTAHIVNLIREVTGEEVTEVYAELETRFADIPVEDVNILSMELSDGTQCIHNGSWSRPTNWPRERMITFRIVGTEGVIDVDSFGKNISKVREAETEDVVSVVNWAAGHNGRFMEDFLAAVREDRTPSTSGRDGIRETAVVEAAYESSRMGEPISIDSV